MATEIIPVLKRVSTTKVLIGGAYSANDVLSESATNTVGTAWTFSNCARGNGRGGYIVSAQALSETNGIVPYLTLFLYKATPTCELDDNAANTAPKHADVANYVGRIDFTAMSSIGSSGESTASATPSTYGNLPIPFICAAADDDLYGVLVTQTAFTQTAGDDMIIILHIEQQ